MKISQSILIVVCSAGLLWGCANPSGHSPEKVASSSHSTNNVADSPSTNSVGTNDEEPEEVLPRGKGNAESLAHFAAGEGLESNGKHDEAMEEFYKSVVADPSNQRTARDVGEWLLEAHQPARAVTLLSKVSQRPDVSGTILSMLAGAQLQAGQTNAALTTSQLAIARRPDLLASYESKLIIQVQAGKMTEALKTLNQAGKHIREKASDIIALANLYTACLAPDAKASDPVRARATQLLDHAATMKFTSTALWERMANTYARLNETKKAVAIYERLVTESVDSPTKRNLLRSRLGEIYLDGRDETNATKQFRAVVKDDASHYPLAWYYLGVLAQAQGTEDKMMEAVQDFQNALRSQPALELAYYRLALVLGALHRTEAALQLLDRAREAFPVSFDSEFYNALVNNEVKEYDDAVKHFAAAETIARTNNPARLDRQFYFQIGAACERAKQFKKAEDYLQKCIDMGPEDAEALNYLGFMWADRGEKLPKAKAYIEKACKMEPTNAAYLDSMGWVLYKMKQPQEALPWMIKAVDLSPEPDPTVLDHLGDVYMSLHQTGKALEFWKKSFNVEPNDDVKKKLQVTDAGAT